MQGPAGLCLKTTKQCRLQVDMIRFAFLKHLLAAEWKSTGAEFRETRCTGER